MSYTELPINLRELLVFDPDAEATYALDDEFYYTRSYVHIDGVEIPREARIVVKDWLQRGYRPTFPECYVDIEERVAKGFYVGAAIGLLVGCGWFILQGILMPWVPLLTSLALTLALFAFGVAFGFHLALTAKKKAKKTVLIVNTVPIQHIEVVDVRKRLLRMLKKVGVHGDILRVLAATVVVDNLKGAEYQEGLRTLLGAYREVSSVYSTRSNEGSKTHQPRRRPR